MNKPYVSKQLSSTGDRYTPQCEKCQWIGPSVSDRGLAKLMLQKHSKTQKHKVLTFGPHRFVV